MLTCFPIFGPHELKSECGELSDLLTPSSVAGLNFRYCDPIIVVGATLYQQVRFTAA